MSDSDPLIDGDEDSHSFVSVISDMFGAIQYKLFMFIFIIFLLISSDTFIGRILSNVNGAVDYRSPTSYGTFLQGLLLVLSCVVLQLLIDQKIL